MYIVLIGKKGLHDACIIFDMMNGLEYVLYFWNQNRPITLTVWKGGGVASYEGQTGLEFFRLLYEKLSAKIPVADRTLLQSVIAAGGLREELIKKSEGWGSLETLLHGRPD